MDERTTETDQIVALFYEHQRVGTLTDACTYSAEREGRDGSELVNPHRIPHVVSSPADGGGA